GASPRTGRIAVDDPAREPGGGRLRALFIRRTVVSRISSWVQHRIRPTCDQGNFVILKEPPRRQADGGAYGRGRKKESSSPSSSSSPGRRRRWRRRRRGAAAGASSSVTPKPSHAHPVPRIPGSTPGEPRSCTRGARQGWPKG